MQKYFEKLLLGFFILLMTCDLFSQIKINEVVSSNDTSCYDENQKSPDWIELYNNSDENINLKNYRIFNKNNFDDAWVLPDTTVKSKEHIILFASNEKRNTSGNYVIEAAGYGISSWNHKEIMRFEYIPIKGDFDIWLNFNSIRDFADNTLAGLMVRDKLTGNSKYVGIICENKNKKSYSVYHRLKEGISASVLPFYNRQIDYPNCKIRLIRTGDTIIAYVWDRNCCWLTERDKKIIMTFSSETAYVGIGFSSGKDDLLSRLTISELNLNGKKFDYSDLKKIEFETNIGGRCYLSNEIHTNFVINRDTDSLYLWDANGKLVDFLSCPRLRSDVSYGRYPDGSEVMKYFAPPSAVKKNENAYSRICETPEFLLQGGWYSSKQKVGFNANVSGDNIYYTVDGSFPDSNSKKFGINLIDVDTNMIIRARSYGEDALPSEVISQSYFINEKSTLPVISLAVSGDDLWNKDYGIFVDKNLFTSREIPVYIEFWNKSKNLIFSNDAGARVHGWLSARLPQKSLRIYARGKYGSKNFRVPYFGEYGLNEYERIVLRNGGTEWWRSMLRDAFSAVVTNMYFPKVDAMCYSPNVMFVNGSFYGIQSIRERLDEYYLGRKFNVPPESIDLLEDWDLLLAGSAKDYLEMTDSVLSFDMKSKSAFEFISRNIDIENIIDYSIINVYFSNVDWPFHNLKCWKSREFDNRWRWVLYDLDYSCGIAFPYDYNNFNTITDSTTNFSILMPKLLENEEFRKRFLNRTADLHNTVFKPMNMLPLIDSLADLLRPEIPRQQAKYDSSAMNWEQEIENIRFFLTGRPELFPSYVVKHFQLEDTANVRLNIKPQNSGQIKISTITPANYPWEGVYYKGVPVVVQAIPRNGYRFVYWEQNEKSESVDTLLFESDTVLTAVFERIINPDTNVVINEIMYKSSENEDSDDWVGIYNAGKGLDLTGWIFKDDDNKHVFVIPEHTYITGDDYLVLCRDTLKFKRVNPEVKSIVGNFDFGLGEKDAVRLFDKDGNLFDFVFYDYREPWPTNSNGTGNSIELINPFLDNELPENWQSSVEINGTPGKINSTYVGVKENTLSDNLFIMNYPNPFSLWTNIEIGMKEGDIVTLSVYDCFGNEVERLVDGVFMYEGRYYIKYENKILSQGVYYIKLQTTKGTKVNQMVVIR